jgi:acetate kinase
MGVELDESANDSNAQCISRPHSRIAAYVVKTDEDLMIARHARALLSS